MTTSQFNSKYTTIEQIVTKVIDTLRINRFDSHCLCDDPEPEITTPVVTRSVIHSMLLIPYYLQYNHNGEVFPCSRAFMNKNNKCKNGNTCPFCIGTSIYIWINKKFSMPLLDNFAKSSGCGFYHPPEEWLNIRQQTYNVLEKIYTTNCLDQNQMYDNIFYKSTNNIWEFHKKIDLKNQRYISASLFDLYKNIPLHGFIPLYDDSLLFYKPKNTEVENNTSINNNLSTIGENTQHETKILGQLRNSLGRKPNIQPEISQKIKESPALEEYYANTSENSQPKKAALSQKN